MLHLDKSPPIRHLDCPTSFLKATCDILAKKENFFFNGIYHCHPSLDKKVRSIESSYGNVKFKNALNIKVGITLLEIAFKMRKKLLVVRRVRGAGVLN